LPRLIDMIGPASRYADPDQHGKKHESSDSVNPSVVVASVHAPPKQLMYRNLLPTLIDNTPSNGTRWAIDDAERQR
jgi:hypothetical protein